MPEERDPITQVLLKRLDELNVAEKQAWANLNHIIGMREGVKEALTLITMRMAELEQAETSPNVTPLPEGKPLEEKPD